MRVYMVWMWLSIGLRMCNDVYAYYIFDVTHAAEKSDELRDVDGCDARGSLYDAQRGVAASFLVFRILGQKHSSLFIYPISFLVFPSTIILHHHNALSRPRTPTAHALPRHQQPTPRAPHAPQL